MTADERWAPAPDDPGYEVSDYGCVRSIPRTIITSHGVERRLPGQILTPRSQPSGHQWVTTANRQVRYVHTLVLTAFVGPRPEGMQGLHWDDDPTNNRLDNLRWGTPSANVYDQVRNGRHRCVGRERCPYDHPLAPPNLVAHEARDGHRSCLACNRAQSERTYARSKGLEIDFQAVSDAHYRDITTHGGAPRSSRFTPHSCSQDDCDHRAVARGMCKRHWQIWSRSNKKVLA